MERRRIWGIADYFLLKHNDDEHRMLLVTIGDCVDRQARRGDTIVFQNINYEVLRISAYDSFWEALLAEQHDEASLASRGNTLDMLERFFFHSYSKNNGVYVIEIKLL